MLSTLVVKSNAQLIKISLNVIVHYDIRAVIYISRGTFYLGYPINKKKTIQKLLIRVWSINLKNSMTKFAQTLIAAYSYCYHFIYLISHVHTCP